MGLAAQPGGEKRSSPGLQPSSLLISRLLPWHWSSLGTGCHLHEAGGWPFQPASQYLAGLRDAIH